MAKKAKRVKQKLAISPAVVWAVVIVILAGVGYYASKSIEGSKAFTITNPINTVYVADTGFDTNLGATEGAPVRTLRKAASLVNASTGLVRQISIIPNNTAYKVADSDLGTPIEFSRDGATTITGKQMLMVTLEKSKPQAKMIFNNKKGVLNIKQLSWWEFPLLISGEGSTTTNISNLNFYVSNSSGMQEGLVVSNLSQGASMSIENNQFRLEKRPAQSSFAAIGLFLTNVQTGSTLNVLRNNFVFTKGYSDGQGRLVGMQMMNGGSDQTIFNGNIFATIGGNKQNNGLLANQHNIGIWAETYVDRLTVSANKFGNFDGIDIVEFAGKGRDQRIEFLSNSWWGVWS